MLARRDQRVAYLRRRSAATVGAMGTRTASYATAEPVTLSIQPASSRIVRELYGERAAMMLTAYCSLAHGIEAGDGFCLGVVNTADPDYLVVGTRNWAGHAELDLERM